MPEGFFQRVRNAATEGAGTVGGYGGGARWRTQEWSPTAAWRARAGAPRGVVFNLDQAPYLPAYRTLDHAVDEHGHALVASVSQDIRKRGEIESVCHVGTRRLSDANA